MVPPPSDMGDEFPDFENMTLEQQMAWLESLARRQGAKEEEFTTSADLEIPIPENPVIDEPGYVPYSERTEDAEPRAPRAAAPVPPDVPAERPEELDLEPFEPAGQGEFLEPEVSAPAPGEMDLSELAEDPMRWLDSLSAHSGQELQDLDLFPEVSPDELPESLSARAEAFFESAELEPPDLTFDFDLEPDAGLDLDLDFGAPAAAPAEMPEEPPVPARAEVTPPPAPVEPPAPEEVELPAAEEDWLGGVDPMRWLESLAVRQGARREELVTSADAEIQEVPPDAVIDEPGYIPYDVITDGRRTAPSVPETVPAAAPRQEPVPEPAPEPESIDESLSWLAELAAEPGASLPGALAVEEPAGAEQPAAPVLERGDPLAGMTDEEIAYAQAHHMLTGEQELAWLQRQAARLAEARRIEEMDQTQPIDEEIEAAVPAELPPWLQQLRQAAEAEVDTQAAAVLGEPALEEEAPAVEEGLPDWLAAPTLEAPAEPGEVRFEADVESLWAETPAEPVPFDEGMISDSELAAFLQGDFVPEEPDALAEALDAEYQRKLSGDDSEPAWYTEAVAQSAIDELFAPEPEEAVPAEAPAEPVEPVEASLSEAIPIEMPDWLKEPGEEEAASGVEAAMPEWLAESPGEAAAAVESTPMPDWLTEEAVPQPLDWLTQVAAEPEIMEVAEPPAPIPAPEPVPPVVERAPVVMEPEVAAPAPRAAVPESALFAKYRQRLEEDPSDYANRLALARALRTNREAPASLDHYEVLIEASQFLQDIAGDLSQVITEDPKGPRARRLLGDTYMRRGMLQEALDAYRSALDQL